MDDRVGWKESRKSVLSAGVDNDDEDNDQFLLLSFKLLE